MLIRWLRSHAVLVPGEDKWYRLSVYSRPNMPCLKYQSYRYTRVEHGKCKGFEEIPTDQGQTRAFKREEEIHQNSVAKSDEKKTIQLKSSRSQVAAIRIR